MKKINNQAGFTLLELLLYVAIVGTLLTSIVAFFGLALDSRVKNQTIAEVDTQGKHLMDTITQAVRNAQSVNSPGVAGNEALLDLETNSAAENPTVFELSGDSLVMREGANAPINLSGRNVVVSNLSFKNLSRPATRSTIQISFSIARVNPSGQNQYDYQQTFISSASLRP